MAYVCLCNSHFVYNTIFSPHSHWETSCESANKNWSMWAWLVLIRFFSYSQTTNTNRFCKSAIGSIGSSAHKCEQKVFFFCIRKFRLICNNNNQDAKPRHFAIAGHRISIRNHVMSEWLRQDKGRQSTKISRHFLLLVSHLPWPFRSHVFTSNVNK